MVRIWIVLLLGSLAWSQATQAAVKANSLIADGAVLQQGIDVPIFGTADDGEKVTVKFQEQTVDTIAKAGRWLVKLKPLKPGGPFTMTITGENTIEVNDLLVGEVWICGGQSNMQFGLKGATNGEQERTKAKDSQIRLFTVPRVGPTQPKRATDNHWWTCDSNTVAYFSAVGYYFGRDLRKTTGVPIGLINANVGGSILERWTSWQTFETDPKLHHFIEGLKPAPVGDTNVTVNVLYNSMIAPLQPYAIRGVIWYQGESNTDPAQYQLLFPAMIKGWRAAWQEGDFPFLFVQLAPGFGPAIREAQLLTWQATPNTAMAVITDTADGTVLHPPNKEPVGHRLALAARALVYGEKIEYSGPIYESMQVDGERIVLHFQHIGSGLMAQEGDLKGFTIAGVDGKFVKAEARIEGVTVVVSSKDVPHPTAARYGWANVPDVNLCNREGLPASPFRTDRSDP